MKTASSNRNSHLHPWFHLLPVLLATLSSSKEIPNLKCKEPWHFILQVSMATAITKKETNTY